MAWGLLLIFGMINFSLPRRGERSREMIISQGMKEERKEKIKKLRQALANLNEEQKQVLIDRGCILTIEGRLLSATNTMLIYLQSNGNNPSVVGGYQQWKKAGKQVKKGEHGMMIFFPVGKKDEDGDFQGNPERFFMGTVFDISQTELIQ